MLISCPKCNAVYNISAEKITSSGKRFKCAECGQIWTVYPEDVLDIEPENTPVKPQIAVQPEEPIKNAPPSPKNEDIEEIFSRISKDTKGLFNNEIEKNEGSSGTRLWRKIQVFMTPKTIIGILFVIICFLTLAVGYFNRYQIVGKVPMLERLYSDIHLESVYAGKDIKIEDVQIRHLEDQGKHYIEISGALFNRGKYIVRMLPIEAILKDNQGNVISNELQNMPQNHLEPNFSAMFRIVLDNPTPEKKQLILKLVQR